MKVEALNFSTGSNGTKAERVGRFTRLIDVVLVVLFLLCIYSPAIHINCSFCLPGVLCFSSESGASLVGESENQRVTNEHINITVVFILIKFEHFHHLSLSLNMGFVDSRSESVFGERWEAKEDQVESALNV